MRPPAWKEIAAECGVSEQWVREVLLKSRSQNAGTRSRHTGAMVAAVAKLGMPRKRIKTDPDSAAKIIPLKQDGATIRVAATKLNWTYQRVYYWWNKAA